MAKTATGQPMRSVERLLDVLTSFSEERPARTIVEISRELDLAPSTVRRLLLVLEQRGFVRQDAETRRYSLHLRLLQLAATVQAGFDLVQLAAPVLDKLREETEETVQLSIVDERDIVQIDNRQSKHLFKIFHPVGHRVTPYAGSAQGKVLLAFMPEAEVRAMLPAKGQWQGTTAKTITDTESLMKHLTKVRKNGYAVNDGEIEPDVWAVAVPVRDHTGDVVAAINVPCPRSRSDKSRQRELIEAVTGAAAELSRILHYDASRISVS